MGTIAKCYRCGKKPKVVVEDDKCTVSCCFSIVSYGKDKASNRSKAVTIWNGMNKTHEGGLVHGKHGV